MIGNDVVDIILSRKESNWQRRGFLQKIFTAEEQMLISNHINHELMVWRLWTMKEAAYKIYNRQTKIRAFIPHKLECTIDGEYGSVSCNGQNYHTKTTINADSIYTIATFDKVVLNNVIELSDNLIVKDAYGHPFVYNNQQKIWQQVSVTHHGKYHKIATFS